MRNGCRIRLAMMRTLQLLIAVVAGAYFPACFAQSDNVGLAVAYVGPQDKRIPCIAYGTEQSMPQVVRAASTKAHCIPLDPIRVFLDSPERVRREQGLEILDDLSRHAFVLDLERVRARFIGPARRYGLPAPHDSEGYEPRWARLSSAHDHLIGTAAGREYERQLIAVHNAFWQSLYARCSGDAKKEGLASFQAIAVINENGLVTEFLPMPNSRNFACFVDGMLHRRYPAPPSVPFYERFTIKIEH